MKKQIINLYFFLLLTSVNLFSQNWIYIDSVFHPSGIYSENFSAPFFCDLNNDGLSDLILGAGSGSVLRFFKNIGPASKPQFLQDTSVFSSIYAAGSVGTNDDYPVLCDLDGDNDFDLIIGGYNGFLYYKNIGSRQSPLWEKVNSIFQQVNTAIGTDAKPELADLDGDGDLDLLAGIGESLFGGPTAGVTLAFRNTGTKFNPVFQSYSPFVSGIPDMGLNSYPAAGDINGDGRIDLVFGRDIASLQYYENTGTVNSPVWTRNTSLFAGVEATTYWKIPVIFDINGDGVKDLIYGNSNARLFFYKNTGTLTTPSFQYDASYFKIIKLNEAASTVSLSDYDNDGDFDMVSGNWLGKFEYFRNEGSNITPVFNRIDLNFGGIDVGAYCCPRFIDINGDGRKDIVSGALDGKIYCYLNLDIGWMAYNTIFNSINVLGFSAPAFADLNNDGKIDLLVCAEKDTNTSFYVNTGNNVFTKDNSFIKNMTFNRSSNPAFFDFDADGDFDLLLGDSWGDLTFFENKGTKFMPDWYRNDTLFANVSVRQSATPGFADLDGDNRADLVLGDYDGNFWFYKNGTIYTSVKSEISGPSNFTLSQNYPNPFNPGTTISYQIPVGGFVTLRVYDMLGRVAETLINTVQSPGKHTVYWNASRFSSGIYYYELRSGDLKATGKMMLVK